MIQWTLYNTATGAVIRTGSAMTVEQANAQVEPGTNIVMQNLNPATQVVTGTTPTPRQTQSCVANKTTFTANGTDFVSISPVEAGALVTITPPTGVGIEPIPTQAINDGVLEITTTVAGTYKVVISKFPKQDFVVNLNAN